MSDYYIDSGADIVALVDPMTSQISPDAFREFVTEYCTDIFSHIRERGRLSSFFVCGHAQKNVEAMCDCGPDNVSIDENIPLDYVRDIARSKGVSFGGNMKLTTVMLFGEENDNLRHAAECIAVAGDSGFILAPGCDIPYAVPPRNISAVSEMVKDEYKLKVAMSLAGTEKAVTTDLDLSDYGGSDRIKIDIITLDSEACAPCQYMVESVKKILPEFEGILDWKEHKIKSKESIELMMALNVKNIPTICIDGNIAFVSQIPRKEELAAAVYKRMIERARYRKAAAKILLLIDDSPESAELKENIGKAQRELGTTILVEEVRDKKKIESEFGVKKLPAVITVREELRSFGKVADKEVVKEWIKAIL
jgi:uroporphyrinogen decarboxylase